MYSCIVNVHEHVHVRSRQLSDTMRTELKHVVLAWHTNAKYLAAMLLDNRESFPGANWNGFIFRVAFQEQH